MKREVNITIEGVQLGSEEEPVIQKISGTYHFTNGKHYIQYEEKLSEAAAATTNTIKIAPAQVILSKKGIQSSQMIFELNEVTKTQYQTPYGNMQLNIKTESVHLSEASDLLELKMNYSLLAEDSHISDHTIIIKITSAL